MRKTPEAYVGRFAPSPTGDLHFGSLLAATASFLQARSRGGAWRVRIDDIDPPREVEGSDLRILADLARQGLEPDGPVLYQSTRHASYRQSLNQLLDEDRAFRCACTRSQLPPGPYPGTCARGLPRNVEAKAVRLRCPASPIRFIDAIQGAQSFELKRDCGDFVIWRADDLPAYQLATAIDDVYQGVTEVVRGADLLNSTPRQIAVQQALGLASPDYAHVPVATLDGRKLSKRERSDPLRDRDPCASVLAALRFLGLEPPHREDLSSLWSWAIRNWSLELVPKLRERSIGG